MYDKKYYRYANENYSITDIPLTENDMNVLSETVEMLKQFKDFSLFSELNGIIQRLEDKVYTETTKQSSIIHLDKNEKLKGLEHLDLLYQAILKELCLSINYQSFKARDASDITFHPFILKQFNNRWFVVGRKESSEQIQTLALDRISKIDYNLEVSYKNDAFDGDDYYKHTIGVTVLGERHVKEIELKLDAYNAPYVLTKPFHHTQEVLERFDDGSVLIKIKVHLNYELERLILGFGNSIEVLKPRQLRNRIRKKLNSAASLYE